MCAHFLVVERECMHIFAQCMYTHVYTIQLCIYKCVGHYIHCPQGNNYYAMLILYIPTVCVCVVP